MKPVSEPRIANFNHLRWCIISTATSRCIDLCCVAEAQIQGLLQICELGVYNVQTRLGENVANIFPN